jgi:hypothetical protein
MNQQNPSMMNAPGTQGISLSPMSVLHPGMGGGNTSLSPMRMGASSYMPPSSLTMPSSAFTPSSYSQPSSYAMPSSVPQNPDPNPQAQQEISMLVKALQGGVR